MNPIRNFITTATSPAADDFAVLDGVTNGTRKILLNGFLAALRNALAPAQGLVMDSSGFATVGTLGGFAGTGAFSLAFTIEPLLPLVNGGQRVFWSWANEVTSINIRYNATTRTFSSGSGPITYTAPDNSRAAYLYVRSSTAASQAFLYRNGVLVQTMTDAVDYVSVSYVFGGNGATAGLAAVYQYPAFFNRALSAAEALALYQNSTPASADYNNASNTSLVTGNDSDFAGAGNWTAFNSATVTVNGGKLEVTSVASGTNGTRRAPGAPLLFLGKKYRITFDVSSSNGTFVVGYLAIGNTVTNISSVSGDGSFTYEFTADRSWTSFGDIVFINGGGTATQFFIDNVKVFPLGLLRAPSPTEPGVGFQWHDISGNKADILLPTTGVSWVMPNARRNVVTFQTSTNGNQQILGQQALPANARITSWVVNRDATAATISLGNASAGAQFVSALALGSGLNDITLLTRFCATNNLWTNSNSTAVLTHTISYEIVN